MATPVRSYAAPRPTPSVAATSFVFALGQLDVTIVNVALPQMARTLGGGIADLHRSAILAAVLLAAAAALSAHRPAQP